MSILETKGLVKHFGPTVALDGMTLAVEPMIAMGDYHVAELEDGWTIVTEDGSVCSHYEHTIAINEHGLPELLTYPGFALTEEAE